MKLKSFGLVLFALCFISAMTTKCLGQKKFTEKLIEKYLSNKKDSSKKSSLFIIPVAALAPETGLEFGVSSLYSFNMDPKDSLNRVSSIDFQGTYTTKKQTKLKAITDLWSKQNNYHYHGEIRYRNFPYSFYGIGSHTVSIDKMTIYEKRFQLQFTADKKIINHYYIGLSAGFDNIRNDATVTGTPFLKPELIASAGGKRVFLGLEQIYDTRDKITYTTHGLYLKMGVNLSPDIFKESDYHGLSTSADVRYFSSLNDKLVLAFNGIYQNISGNNIAFYYLPQLGSDVMMRGYYQGRFRDKSLLAGQSELRYRFTQRFGIVAFGGLGTVYGQQDLSMQDVKPEYGAGLRYFFDLKRDLSVRIDYGIGQKLPNEKRFSGVYFSMNEAF